MLEKKLPLFPFFVIIYFYLFFGKRYGVNKFHQKIDIRYPLRFSIPRLNTTVNSISTQLPSPIGIRKKERKKEKERKGKTISCRGGKLTKKSNLAREMTFLGARNLVDPRVIVLAGSAVTTLQRCFPSIMLNWTVYSSKGKGSGVASEIAVSVEKLRAEEELWPTMRPTCRKERKKERKV